MFHLFEYSYFFCRKCNFISLMHHIIFFYFSVLIETMTFDFKCSQTWVLDMSRSIVSYCSICICLIQIICKFVICLHTGNSIFLVLKSFFLITVLATRSNIPPLSIFITKGMLISVFMSLITASASGPNFGILLPCFLYVLLKRPINSAVVIGFLFLASLTLSWKCRVNSTSIPTAANNLSAYF